MPWFSAITSTFSAPSRMVATVHIYNEGRLAKIESAPSERPKIDPAFDEVAEGEEVAKKERLEYSRRIVCATPAEQVGLFTT